MAAALFTAHAKLSGERFDPPTALGFYFFCLFFLIPPELSKLIAVYLIYYFSVRYLYFWKTIRSIGGLLLLLFNVIYICLVQILLGDELRLHPRYSLAHPFTNIDFFFFYFTVVFMIEIDIEKFVWGKEKLVAKSN
jgi:hypothetical protein